MKRPNVDAMLEEMEGGQLAEWRAFEDLEEEAQLRSVLQGQAEAGVEALKRQRPR